MPTYILFFKRQFHSILEVVCVVSCAGADPNARDSLDRSALVIAFIVLELDNIHSAAHSPLQQHAAADLAAAPATQVRPTRRDRRWVKSGQTRNDRMLILKLSVFLCYFKRNKIGKHVSQSSCRLVKLKEADSDLSFHL